MTQVQQEKVLYKKPGQRPAVSRAGTPQLNWIPVAHYSKYQIKWQYLLFPKSPWPLTLTSLASASWPTLLKLPDTFPLGNLANNRLIKCDQPVDIKFSWAVSGIFAHVMDPNSQWKIQLFFEKYGPGEFAFPVGIGETTLRYGSGTLSGVGLGSSMTIAALPTRGGWLF